MATLINSTAPTILEPCCLQCRMAERNHQQFFQQQISAVQDLTNSWMSQAKELLNCINQNIIKHFHNQKTIHQKSENEQGAPSALSENARQKSEFVQIPLVDPEHSQIKSPQASLGLSYSLYEIERTSQEIFSQSKQIEPQINLTQIDLKVEQTVQADYLYIHQMVQELNSKIKLFDFKIRRNHDSFYFDIGEKKVTFKREDEKLMQLMADRSISKIQKQRVGIKVLNNRKGWIYFGLMNELHMKQKSIAKAKSKNMISYKISGGKQLYVPTSAECISVPEVPQNSCLYMETDYAKGTIDFFIDQVKVITLNINFAGLDWFPFLTFKHKDDSVEIL